MQLQLSTWLDVKDYLTKRHDIIIPIGSTEQHGPMGLIGTDAICPEAIAKAFGDQNGIMVAPTINFGMAQHHMAFKGTMTLRPTTLIAVVEDCVHSLLKHGFKRILFLNGHGGNIPIVQTAFQQIYTHSSLNSAIPASGIRCELISWWTLPGVKTHIQKLYGDKEGTHATPSEVAVTWHIYPKHSHKIESPPLPSKVIPYTDCDDFRFKYPDGRIGAQSSLATPQDGEEFIKLAVKDLEQALNKMV